MRRVKLDRIDRRILADLQAEGRITNVELAKRAGISAPPCLRRVRALEQAGFIRGYHADLDAPSLISGLLFLLLGLAFLAKQTGWVDVEAAWVWPALLVGLGVLDHLPTRPGAVAARLGTLSHVLVVGKLLARRRALVAARRAALAGGAGERALAGGQGVGQLAALAAVSAQLHRLGVLLLTLGQ